MRYHNCCKKYLKIENVGYFEIICPNSLENGTYEIEYGTSGEVALVNGSPYGWFVGDTPILKRETEHGIYTRHFDELYELFETSSFWEVEITDEID